MRGLATIPTRTHDSLRPRGYRQSAFLRPGGMRNVRSNRPSRQMKTRQMKDEGSGHPDEDELLTVAMAAALAGRSVRTIRRAYRTGTLLAYRDGNGRGIRIRYGDLRQWMMATTAVASERQEEDEALHPLGPLERLDMGGRVTARVPSENLALLNAARARRRRGVAPVDGAGRRAAAPPASSSA